MFRLLLLIVTCVSLSHTLFATHIAGGEITYECLGNNQYRFHLNLYRDCDGVDLDELFQTLEFVSSCGENLTLDMTIDNPGGTEISQLCSSQATNTTCQGGVFPGMESYTFSGTITLSPCDTWNISWSDCCRNEAIVNLDSPDSQGFYIEATLRSASAICNNSPIFVNEPIPYTCVNQELNYSFGVSESQGDSIHYKLIGAREDNISSLGYVAGFSPTVPIVGLTIDSITGLVTFTPVAVGNYVVVVLVEEFDSIGNPIGSILRDIQFVVQTCTNNIPNTSDGIISNLSSNAIQSGPYSLDICKGSSFTFSADYGDLDLGDSLFMNTNIKDVLPNAQVTVTGVNPLTITFTADVNPIGGSSILYFEVNIRDNACPVVGRQDFAYQINLLERTIATRDTTICGTQQAELNAYLGNNFTWSVVSGEAINVGTNFSCNPCSNPLANPSVSTVYEVVSDIVTGCINRDTVSVTVGVDFTTSLTVNVDPTFCALHKASLIVDNQPADTYTYSWSNGAFLDNAAIFNPQTNMIPAGTYEFIYQTRNSSGCVKMDSVTLTSLEAPILILSGDTMLCVGDSTQLVMQSPLNIQDNFNTALNNKLWASVNGALLNANCGAVSGNALHFNALPRLAETNPINTSLGGTISFDIIIGSGVAPCDDAEAGDDIFFQYSIDGGLNWITINTFFANSFANFSTFTLIIPAGAISPATLFRWSQPINDGVDTDNWAIDNVSFNVVSDLSGYTRGWFEGASLISIQDTLIAKPIVQTTYQYMLTDNLTSCIVKDSIKVNVSPIFGFISSADTAACVPDIFNIHSTPNMPDDYTFSWAPNTGLSSTTDSLVTVTLTESTKYLITVTSVQGCTQTDTIDISMTELKLPNIAGDTALCLGESSLLTVIHGFILNDDFEGATTNSSLWSSVGGALLNTDCGSVAGNALHFDDFPRTAETNAFSTVQGGTITFNLVIGSGGSPCEDADDGEDVLLEYSIDGGANWILIDTYLTTDFATFTQVVVTIPPGAMSNATMFRWDQPVNDGSGTDNWALDNVQFDFSTFFPPNTVFEWFEGQNLLATGDSLLVTPVTDTYFRYVLRDTIALCSLEDSVLVIVGPLFTLTTTPDQILCTPTNLNLTVTPSLTDDYNFTWTPGTNLTSSTDSAVVANPSSSINYAIEITSVSGCTQLDTIDVYISNLVPPFITGDTLLCIGDSTMLSMITIQSSEDQFDGATPDPDLWSTILGGTLNSDCGSVSGNALHFDNDPRTAETTPFNTLPGGTITFELIMGSGFSPCEEADLGDEVLLEYSIDGGNNWITIDTYFATDFVNFTQVVVTIPPAAMSASTMFRWAQPNNSGSGFDNWAIDNVKIEINSNGNLTSYTSNWFDGASLIGSLDSISVKPIVNTTYNYILTDNISGCTTSKLVNVLVGQAFTLSSKADTTVCIGSNIQLFTAPSDPGSYTYSWSPTTNLGNPTAISTSAIINDTINYIVTATSNFGCVAIDSVLVSVFPVITVLVAGDNAICIGDSSELTASGADTYSWNNASSLNTAVGDTVIATPGDTTTYTVTGVVGACSNTANFILTVNPLPIDSIATPPDLTCLVLSVTLSDTSAGNTIVWDGPGLSGAANPASTSLPGTYTATVTSPITGCITTTDVVVNQPNILDAAFVANPLSGIKPHSVQFQNNSQNALTYEWYFGENLLVNATTTDASNLYDEAGTYQVMLVATNALGCTDTAFATIVVLNPVTDCSQYTIIVPNIITANGDLINDVLTITHNISVGFKYDCQIFNRWGNLVFESNDINKPWDGKAKNGDLCSEGVYFYKISFSCGDEKETKLDGSIQLVTE